MQSGFQAVEIEIFRHLFASVAEEMGVTLGRTGYSPNIKERHDYSCAVFLGDGRMLAQAAHIPVHLGAMPASVRAAIEQTAPFQPGDVVILNDPYLGGTHLPDITLVSPLFVSNAPTPDFFIASRAHHADIGGMSPGSMPISTELYQEGLIIPPIKLVEAKKLNNGVQSLIIRNSRTPDERLGDLAAQQAAHQVGERRMKELIARYGLESVTHQAEALIDYARRLTETLIGDLPDGQVTFSDKLDNDGHTTDPVPIKVTLTISGSELIVNFAGSAPAVQGNVNAVRAIVESVVGYTLRCIAGDALPMNQGVFAPVDIRIPENSILDAKAPHAVAGGNVETSMRITDVMFGAFAQLLPDRIPAASQGTMNNLTFGGISPEGIAFAYYETMGGGSGASATADGASGIHCHMSNTLNTPIEAMELSMPVRVITYAIRRGSGGLGQQQGGDGLIREIQFLTPTQVTLLTERREAGPYGLLGGSDGTPGKNTLVHTDGSEEVLPGKISLRLQPGESVRVETPGGGGWGSGR